MVFNKIDLQEEMSELAQNDLETGHTIHLISY